MSRKEKPIETMLVLSMGCLLVNVLFHWKPALYLCFGFGLTGIFSGWLSRQIDRVWMWVARVLGWLSNGLLLSVVYLLVLLPVALIRRMRNKDRLTYFDKAARSNFIARDHLFTKEDLEKMW
jgi:apolipoprotein N-acyltransferase